MKLFLIGFGLVEFNSTLTSFIHTPEFQRLGQIKMGLWHTVYPAAIETRLTHSLEVAHLAGMAARTLGMKHTYRMHDLIMVAGLLHDIGHVATCHVLDHVLEEKYDSNHEDRSCQVVREIYVKKYGLLHPSEGETVCCMIKGIEEKEDSEPWWYHLVHHPNSDNPDVDRLAYLHSNGIYCGLPRIDPSFMIQHMVVDADGGMIYSESCQTHVDIVQRLRAHMHRVCYQHSCVKHVERVYLSAIAKCVDLVKLVEGLEWLNLTDAALDTVLRRGAPKHMLAIDTHACKEFKE